MFETIKMVSGRLCVSYSIGDGVETPYYSDAKDVPPAARKLPGFPSLLEEIKGFP